MPAAAGGDEPRGRCCRCASAFTSPSRSDGEGGAQSAAAGPGPRWRRGGKNGNKTQLENLTQDGRRGRWAWFSAQRRGVMDVWRRAWRMMGRMKKQGPSLNQRGRGRPPPPPWTGIRVFVLCIYTFEQPPPHPQFLNSYEQHEGWAGVKGHWKHGWRRFMRFETDDYFCKLKFIAKSASVSPWKKKSLMTNRAASYQLMSVLMLLLIRSACCWRSQPPIQSQLVWIHWAVKQKLLQNKVIYFS